MSVKHNLISVLSLICLGTCAFAQSFSPDSLQKRFSIFGSYCSPEKLYLHIDRTYFTAGETLWFKGYLEEAIQKSIVPCSNFIYVELLDNNGAAVCRTKVKRSGSGFPGHLTLGERLKTGTYTLRAYTLWQLNVEPDFLFNQSIDILGDSPAPKKQWQPVDKDKIDVSFYPEGGRYFAGVKSSIGFKAVDQMGRSVDVQGSLQDGSGNTLVGFIISRHDGMGCINFVPQQGEKYFFLLNSGKRFQLPDAAAEGVSLSIRRYKGKLYAAVSGTSRGTLYLLQRNHSFFNALAQFEFEGKTKLFELESELLSPGINHILIADGKGSILSERLFFHYDNAVPVCTLTAVEKAPKPHGVIHTALRLQDANGEPLDGECSVAVVRGSFKNHLQNEGLPAYMLLSSELKGHINNPDYYFDPSVNATERDKNMDLLMMIQGWRYYDIEKIITSAKGSFKIKQFREYVQTIKGRISQHRAKKLPKNFIFSVMIPKLKFVKYTDVKTANSFTIDSLDFKEGTEFLISVTKPGLGRDYIPRWSGDTFAPDFKYYPAPGIAGAVVEEDKVPLVSDVVQIDTLNAAVVSAETKEVFNNAFGGTTRNADDLKAYENMTVIEYLTLTYPVFEYNGDIMYNRRLHNSDNGGEEEEENAAGRNADTEFTDESGIVRLIYKDNEEPWWPYENIHIDEVEAISVSTMGDPSYNSPGGIVMINLKEGAKIAKAGTRDSFLYFIPLGYQKPSEFYSPRYDLGDKREGFDHRNTIFWTASNRISGGLSYITFCNTDQMDYPYIVRIEGITSGGTLFSGRSTLNFEESY